MSLVIGIFLIVGSLSLYFGNRRLFFLSIFLVYPFAAQMVNVDFNIMGISLNISMTYGGILFVICFIEFFRQIASSRIHKNKWLTIISILFLFSCFASILFSSDKYESLLTSTKIASWILLLLICRDFFRKQEDLLLISRLAIASSLIIVVSYIAAQVGLYGSALGGYKYYDYKIDVAVGHFYSAVSLAYPLAVNIPIILIGLFITGRKIWLFAILTNLLFLLLTYVRTPLLSLGPAFIVFAHYISKLKIKHFSKSVGVACIIFICVFLIFQSLHPGTATKRWTELQEQVQYHQYEKLGSGRVGLAMNALEFQMERQTILGHLFGIGIGNTGSISKSKKIVHNGFLEVWLGCGLFGLLLFIFYISVLLNKLVSIMKKSRDKLLQIVGALAVMNCCIFIVGSLDVILTAVFPMCLFAIHVGSTLGFAEEYATANKEHSV